MAATGLKPMKPSTPSLFRALRASIALTSSVAVNSAGKFGYLETPPSWLLGLPV
jgi:hypothetical protein